MMKVSKINNFFFKPGNSVFLSWSSYILLFSNDYETLTFNHLYNYYTIIMNYNCININVAFSKEGQILIKYLYKSTSVFLLIILINIIKITQIHIDIIIVFIIVKEISSNVLDKHFGNFNYCTQDCFDRK